MEIISEEDSTSSFILNETTLEQPSCSMDTAEMSTSVYVNSEDPVKKQTILKMSSGTEMSFSVHSIKDYASRLTCLQKENFSLKVRIYEMENMDMWHANGPTLDSGNASDKAKDLNNIIEDKDRLLEKARIAIDSMMMKHEEEKVMIAEHNSRTHQNYETNEEIIKQLEHEMTKKAINFDEITGDNYALNKKLKLLKNELIETQKRLQSKMNSTNIELKSKDVILDKDLIIQRLNDENKSYQLELKEKEKSLNASTRTQTQATQRLQAILVDRLNKTNQILDEVIKKDQSFMNNTTMGDNNTSVSINRTLPEDMINSIKDIITETSLFSESFMDQNEIEVYLNDLTKIRVNESLDIKLDRVLDQMKHLDSYQDRRLTLTTDDLNLHISPIPRASRGRPIGPAIRHAAAALPEMESARSAPTRLGESLNRDRLDDIDSLRPDIYVDDELRTSMEFSKDINNISTLGITSYDSIKDLSPEHSAISMPTLNTVTDSIEIDNFGISLDGLRSEYEHRELILRNDITVNHKREQSLTNEIAALREQIAGFSQLQSRNDCAENEMAREVAALRQRIFLQDEAQRDHIINENQLCEEIRNLRTQVITYSNLKTESDGDMELLRAENERLAYQITLFSDNYGRNATFSPTLDADPSANANSNSTANVSATTANVSAITEKGYRENIASLRNQLLDYSQSKTDSDLLQEKNEEEILNLKNKIADFNDRGDCNHCKLTSTNLNTAKQRTARMEIQIHDLLSEIDLMKVEILQLREIEEQSSREKRIAKKLRREIQSQKISEETAKQKQLQISQENQAAIDLKSRDPVNISPDFYKLNPEICKLEGKIKHMEKINRQLRMQVNTKNQTPIGREYINDCDEAVIATRRDAKSESKSDRKAIARASGEEDQDRPSGGDTSDDDFDVRSRRRDYQRQQREKQQRRQRRVQSTVTTTTTTLTATLTSSKADTTRRPSMNPGDDTADELQSMASSTVSSGDFTLETTDANTIIPLKKTSTNNQHTMKRQTINNVSEVVILNTENICQQADYKIYLRKMSQKIKKLKIENGSLKSNLKTETNKKETVKQELQRLYILMKGNNSRKENMLNKLENNKVGKTITVK